MFDTNWLQRLGRSLLTLLMAVFCVWSLAGCGNASTSQAPGRFNSTVSQGSKISEVSPPQVIQELRQALENYQPQVTILNPQPNEVLQDNTVTARFQVQDLPIFKNAELGLGPHLHVFLDNQPYQAVYNLNQPLVFNDVPPGTHTLRVFASRPWHESFKNEGAYAQTTFHIFTKTEDNNPNSEQPLLTYSRPQGSYGAEPIMLDFYLTNAPLHLVAQENSKDEIADWQIRCTINGNSFVIDQWQPIYLKGFQPGKNWVELELLDEQGNPVKNVFNNTVRLINYEPNGQDALSRLVRGELSVAEARGIVDPNYVAAPPEPTPTPTLTPTLIPTPAATPTPIPELAAPETPTVGETPAAEQPQEVEPVTPEVEPATPAETQPTTSPQPEKPKSGGFFNRFRRPATDEVTPSPSLPLTPPEAVEPPSPEPVVPEESIPQAESSATQTPEVEPIQPTVPVPTETKRVEKPSFGGYFNRFRRPAEDGVAPSPSLPPTLPEIVVTPSPEPISPEVSAPPSETVPEPISPEASVPPLETVPETEASPEPTVSVEKQLMEQLRDTNSSVEAEEKTNPIEPSPKPAKPKLDLKKVFFPQPAPTNSPLPIITAPAEPEIPSRFLKRSVPETPTPEATKTLEAQETPTDEETVETP